MKPVFGKIDNDCMRASFASILELDYAEVADLRPEVSGGESQELRVREFLRSHGMFLSLRRTCRIDPYWPGYHLMYGRVVIGNVVLYHATVGLKGVVAHDPHESPQATKLSPYADGTYDFGYLHFSPKYSPAPFYSL